MLVLVSGLRVNNKECDNSGEMIEKDGFLVVVVMRVMVWFFIVGSRMFCWVLEKWCILLMKRMVGCFKVN